MFKTVIVQTYETQKEFESPVSTIKGQEAPIKSAGPLYPPWLITHDLQYISELIW